MFERPLNILMICDYPSQGVSASTIADHIHTLAFVGRHNVHVLSNQGEIPEGIPLEAFDAVVVHYSIYLLDDNHLGPRSRERLAAFQGLKVLFLQDEYRHIYEFVRIIDQLGIDVLFTCLPERLADACYPVEALPRLRKVQCLTGYVPERLLNLPASPIATRPIDVFYRGRRNGFWLGSLALDKWRIVDLVRPPFRKAGLNVDLAYEEDARLYGDDWVRALQSSRAVLGVESGASVLDFTGNIERRATEYLRRNPNATYEETEAACFPGRDMLASSAQISPRCFEAAAVRTPLILFEGCYSDILVPWRHFIPLAKDGSNLPQVIEHLRSLTILEELADNTYRDIACNPKYSYRALAEMFDNVCAEETSLRRTALPRTDPAALHALLFAHARGSTRVPLERHADSEAITNTQDGEVGVLTASRRCVVEERTVWIGNGPPTSGNRLLNSVGRHIAMSLARLLSLAPTRMRRFVRRGINRAIRFLSILSENS